MQQRDLPGRQLYSPLERPVTCPLNRVLTAQTGVYSSMVLKLVLTTFMLNSCLECFVLSSHVPLFDSSSLLVAKLYSEIKPDDSRVKGTKKGKAKKKKSTVDPFEKKKPKLDELKVQSRQTKLNVFH